MANSAVTILDGNGVARDIDAQTTGTDYQQTVTIGDGANAGRVAAVGSDGALLVAQGKAAAAAVTSVTAAATSTTVLASNAARRLAIVYNDSTASLYLKFGATASLTSFTVEIPSDSVYELPQPMYTGVLDGIWSAANGAARVTELT